MVVQKGRYKLSMRKKEATKRKLKGVGKEWWLQNRVRTVEIMDLRLRICINEVIR